MSYLKASVLKSSSVVQEKGIQFTQKKKQTAAIPITIRRLFIIINRFDTHAAAHTPDSILPMSGQTAKHTHTLVLIHLLTSQSLTVRSAAQL